MAAENVGFLDALVSEEAIGRFRARPVLASERYAAAHAVADLFQQLAKTSTKTGLFEGAFIDLTLSPMLEGARTAMILATQARRTTRYRAACTHEAPRRPTQVLSKESQAIHPIQDFCDNEAQTDSSTCG
jgi:hypothetical protein